MNVRFSFFFVFLSLFLLCCGCTGILNQDIKPGYLLAENGSLTLQIPPPQVKSEIIRTDGLVGVEELTFQTFEGDVSMVLVTPENPRGSFVWVPGAGVPASGHIDHLMTYAQSGFAVLVVDVRGNGGKTPGYPLNIEADFKKLNQGQWPQIYLIIADLVMAEQYLHERYGPIPVFIVGESNGGRYAAVAAAADQNFSGYGGISTSGYGRQGDMYTGTSRSFLLSIDPECVASRLSNRPSFIFHAPADHIIPYESGKKLAATLGEMAQFLPFNGTHGVTGEVDAMLIEKICNVL